jgi:NAD+ synthase (glutamine-hydrolysing)
MKDTSNKIDFGFARVAAAIPEVYVADPMKNATELARMAKEAASKGVQVIAFPELSLTGYTCGDLFNQIWLQDEAIKALEYFVRETTKLKLLSFVGLPLRADNQLFNVAAAVSSGKIIGLIPKSYIPGYKEFYEPRWFSPAKQLVSRELEITGQKVPMGTDLLFSAGNANNLIVAAEICEDIFMPIPPSSLHSLNGATIIVNLSASPDIIGKAEYRRSLVANQSARCNAGYVYVSSTSATLAMNSGESTSDVVFGGDKIIGDNGTIIEGEKGRFETESSMLIYDIDVERLARDRVTTDSYGQSVSEWACDYRRIAFEAEAVDVQTKLYRGIDPLPFVPRNPATLDARCEEIFSIQTTGLVRRLRQVAANAGENGGKATIGISGGLDSTLALLVALKTFDILDWSRKNIITVTMPGYGTTLRTRTNAEKLCRLAGTDFREIPISDIVTKHLRDLGHEPCKKCLMCQNAQARERTQILMDLGFVIGTGDLSEIALGWSTYNGDQQSMYNVNAGIPKTLVRHVVGWEAKRVEREMSKVLTDILNTAISPELTKGKQKTEDLIGPYELHDFFLFNMLRNGFSPKKILFLAIKANTAEKGFGFSRKYSYAEIIKWLKLFYTRFAPAQFKRDSAPDGPKVGSVALSQRGDWRMPADITLQSWIVDI